MPDIAVSADDLESSLQKKEEFVKIVSITIPRSMNYDMVIKVNKGIIPLNPMMIPDLEMGPNRCSVQ